LAIVGITLAVLAVTLLAGTGTGVIDTGQQQFQQADRDLWITAGQMRISPASGGGFTNTLVDSRNVTERVAAHESVRFAGPLAFETVYTGTEPTEEFETFVGIGVPGGGPSVQVTEGEDLSGDPHYADGTYEGERTREVLIDRETANALNVSVGDTLYVGGSLAAARENEVTVRGISPTYQRMLGTPTVTMPLSELHQVTGTTGTEPATFIVVTLEDGADVDAVQTDLQQTFPEYEVRTNQEQFEATLQEQVLVLAAGTVLVILAIVSGIALTFNLLSLVVYQQRREFAALNAQGISSTVLVLTVMMQGVVIGSIGGGIALLLTRPSVTVLNGLSARLVGFEGLVQTADWIYVSGLAIAVLVGTAAAAIAGWRVSRTPSIEHLR
jgi:putative ABC transport system permease protein